MDLFFKNQKFGSMYMKCQLNVPGPKPLPKARFLGNMPYVIVADEAFPLCPNIMIHKHHHHKGEKKEREK